VRAPGGRIAPWAVVAAVVAVSTALRALASRGVQGPWISPDETVYALLGQSLYRHGSLTILGGPTPFYSLVVPALVGPFLSLGDLELGYALLKPFLALVMSLAAVPVYLWGRSVAGRGWALAAAALTAAAPGLAYSGLVMSEVVFYPVVTLAAWATAAAIADPSRRHLAALAACVTLALLTRLQALVLLPVVAAAVLLDAAFARAPGRLVRGAPVLAAATVPTVGWLVLQQLRGEPVLGAYESTTAASYAARGAARFVLYHAGALVLTTGVIPVCALLALGLAAGLRGERDPLRRATVAAGLALAVGVVLQVGVFASAHVGQLAERDLLCVVPSLLVCFALWLDSGTDGDRRLRLVAAGVALAALAALPLGTLVTYRALFDSITLAPLWHLEDATSARALTTVVLACAVVACAAFVFLPRRLRIVLPVSLLAVAVAGSVASAREVTDQARRTRVVLVGRSPRWLDAASHGRSATYVYDGNRDWPAVWQALFWNRSIRHVAILGATKVPGPVPQRPLDLRADGRISARDPDVVLPSSYTAQGTQVAETGQLIPGQEGLRRWRLEGPPRILTRTLGLQAGGDIYGRTRGTLIAYGCSRGTWALTLIPKEPQTVVLLQNGKPYRRYRFGPGEPPKGYVNLDLPASARPGSRTCRLDVDPTGLVGTTRFGFVPQTPP
jgi:hypothetical protein